MCENKYKVTGRATLLVLLGVIYLTSCTLIGLERTPTPTPIQDPDLIDRSWYTGDPCLPPCWYDMEIGKTTFDEASQQVRTLSFVDVDSIWEGEADYIFFPYPTPVVKGMGINLYCRQPESKTCARMWFVDDVLMDIFIFPNYQVTFLEVVKYLGEPDLILVGPAHIPMCKLSIIWSVNQLIITHSEDERGTKRRLCQMVLDSDDKIPTDLFVWSVAIQTKESLNRLAIKPWQGFIHP
jgi:hypothetical protein